MSEYIDLNNNKKEDRFRQHLAIFLFLTEHTNMVQLQFRILISLLIFVNRCWSKEGRKTVSFLYCKIINHIETLIIVYLFGWNLKCLFRFYLMLIYMRCQFCCCCCWCTMYSIWGTHNDIGLVLLKKNCNENMARFVVYLIKADSSILNKLY